jgi:hypothetical protein
VSKELTWLSQSPILRVWLPSRRCQQVQSLEACLSSQRSWDSLFRAFFLSDDPKSVSTSCSIPALPEKTARPSQCASMASAHPKSSASHLLPKGLVRGETSCSPEVFGLPGPLSPKPIERASPSPNSPRVLKSYRLSTITPGTSGFPVLGAAAFPPVEGASLPDLSHRPSVPTP